MSAPRLIAVLALGLLLVTGLAYAASQTIASRESPRAGEATAYVGAPTPPRVRPPVPAGAALGAVRVAPGWLTRTAEKTGIPRPAVRAYARAQLTRPLGCDVGWTTLAGVGWVESQHGTLGGRELLADGRSSSRILGPALDGSGEFAAIPSTSTSRAWHGDPRWEHALGPMQFLWSSWEPWAADADGDGRADPHDLDDAAAAAAAYLCAGGGDLTTAEGWTDAVFSYNHAQEYVDAVLAAARAYAGAVA
ncbi:lytic murein transglycosylase [Nocardioides ferulae]|uniref:lytic murein transglycosylase n=1 Tax=Nocardioides ferulae TaxID=2340821 RepID=UPI000EB41F71|nr:lytic murein transglycosylase [Nocardioides ferulae]